MIQNNYLETLEQEAIYILRETAAQFENQLCFSQEERLYRSCSLGTKGL